MDEYAFHAPRAEMARFGAFFSGATGKLLPIFSVLLLLSGIFLVALEYPIGWLIAGFSVIPGLLSEWSTSFLQKIPTGKTEDIVDKLDGEIIMHLPFNPTPKDIAQIVGTTHGGAFFAMRFGITANFLLNIAAEESAETPKIFASARAVARRAGSEHINSTHLVYALIENFSGYEQLLAQFHLDIDDLFRGATWHKHLQSLIASHKKKRHTGGIARDWSFGYIPLLTRYGQNISEQIERGGLLHVELEAHQEVLSQMLEIFGTRGKQNAALIGLDGAGKTAIVHAFAQKILDANEKIPTLLKYRQVFVLDAASLIGAAPGRGELEGLLQRVLSEAYAAKNIIICLDKAELFFEEGVGSVDISNVLLPILEAGNLRLILTIDEQKFLQISQRNASLANALNRISVQGATRDETLLVLQDKLIMTEFSRNVIYTYQSLQEIYALSERYIHDMAMPGRAIKLLESAAGFVEAGLVTINSVQKAIEQTANVKVSVASESEERDKLLNLESLLHQRMIGQERAVAVVSDALRRARSGVRNQNRPIGTFLFLGPTGVGKTELAKALAQVYFGGEEHIVRLDLNEYVTLGDVGRLIADPAEDPNSLTAQVMKQPFSVVLFDEIEKAHPNVLTTLLQLLDEGVLRDIKNREVSFRDCIIIATTNAGSDRVREYIERGYQLEQFEKTFIDELINANIFRPEFLNRFDEILTFKPLEKTELFKIVELIISGINKTLAPQKITVQCSQDLVEWLVNSGYDPRLGARPMRRIVQKVVENTLAKRMLAGEVSAGMNVLLTSADIPIGLQTQANTQTLQPTPQQ